jgi:ectoine hydroxylase-related dioxygenase (phytanoyl-CoA dioxygenase family)
MKSYKKLKLKLNKQAIDEVVNLPYYVYEDRDLKESVLACAIKSIDGQPDNLFKNIPDLCKDYKLTSIAGQIPTITKYITSFKCDVGRARIFRQEPGKITQKHIDEENYHNPKEKHLIVWIAINGNPDFKILLGDDEITLNTGEAIVFDPDSAHGAKNLSKTETRFSLNLIIKPNNWLKENCIEY